MTTQNTNPAHNTAQPINQFARFMALRSQISYQAMVSFMAQHGIQG